MYVKFLVTLPECVVYDFQLNRRECFFAVIYRTSNQELVEFDKFTENFELSTSRMRLENPSSIVVTGDFNCRSNQWRINDIENNNDKLFEQ